jgi:CRP/FNR family transcriptional regulator, cyclic AMP receptor protein
MFDNYQGKEGRAALLNALRSQFLVDGNSDIANMMASATRVKDFFPGEVLFTEGERGGDLFFIIEGRVSVRKGEREIATIDARMHVGEIGLLEPYKGRSASAIAIDRVVVAQVSQMQFTEIAGLHPDLWRRMALELAHRLVKTQDAV